MNTDLITTTAEATQLTDLIARADLAESTRNRYSKALTGYLATGNRLTDAEALRDYALTLGNDSAKAHLAAAVSLWVREQKQHIKATVTPDTVDTANAAMMRLEALTDAITVKRKSGTKTHTWLSQTQVKRIFQAIPDGIIGERDRVLLGLLVGAGLRREEAANLTFADVILQPVGDRFRTVLSVTGKGDKSRTVPISDQLANAIDVWGRRIGHTGRVLRSLGMNREPGESISAVAIFQVVRKYGDLIDKPELAAHDLRRTYAQFGLAAGIPITQISQLLGHASVATTQKYLDLSLDLETTISDFVPMW